MKWKPIKTAPKNKHILVTGFGYDLFTLTKTRRRFYGGAKWSAEHQNFVDPWRESEEFVELTHWCEIAPIKA